MFCKKWGNELKNEDAKFCDKCGAKVETEEKVRAGGGFCKICGAPLSGFSPIEDDNLPEGDAALRVLAPDSKSIMGSMTSIDDILAKFAQKKASVSVDEFLQQELKASGEFEDTEIDGIIAAISGTLKSNRENREKIAGYRAKGLGADIFLRDAIDGATAALPPEERTAVIENTKTAFAKANVDLFNKLNGAEVEEIVPPLASSDFSDLNKTAIAQNLRKEIELNTNMHFIALEGAFEAAEQGAKKQGVKNQGAKEYKK